MGKKIDISVLIPCYDEAPYIMDAVQSVVKQTFSNWELVIVNDGSTDGTAVILERVLQRYRRYPVSVVATDHQGCAGATKTAIAFSVAPLCTILDGDDLFTEKSLEVVVKAFRQNRDIDYMWSKYIARADGTSKWKPGRSKALPPGKTLKEALLSGWWGALAQRSFRRSAYALTKGLDARLPYAVDQQLSMLFANANCKAQHLPIVTYQHLQHKKQMSAVHYRDQQRCRGEILKQLGGSYVKER